MNQKTIITRNLLSTCFLPIASLAGTIVIIYIAMAENSPHAIDRPPILRTVAATAPAAIAFPKYYIWVKVYKGASLVTQGAVRVAAVDKESFDVTHFVSDEQIRKNPTAIETIFPASLCPAIDQRAQDKGL